MNSLLYPYLQDTTFLFQLAKEKVIELYTKITVLNHAEQPIQDVTGRIINGSLNVDGKSAVRRTGNLTVHIEDEAMSFMAVNGLFSINKKLKIEVGVLNQTDKYAYDALNTRIRHTTCHRQSLFPPAHAEAAEDPDIEFPPYVPTIQVILKCKSKGLLLHFFLQQLSSPNSTCGRWCRTNM